MPPVVACSQEAAAVEGLAEAVRHAGLLALVFERLPAGDQFFTVSRLSKEWRRWAAPKAASTRGQASKWEDNIALFAVPLWFLQESCGRTKGLRPAVLLERAAWHGDLATLEWMQDSGRSSPADMANLCLVGAGSGHLEVLQWARQHGCPCWDESTCAAAASSGHLEVLQWARQHGCPWDESTCTWAAGSGHLNVLQWARQHGCRWDQETSSEAAVNGHLDVLQWAQQNGCPWDLKTCSEAAASGHLEVLRWARQHGCPWDVSTCTAAAGNGHLEVLQWARQHRCPWDTSTCVSTASMGHFDLLQWALQHGCPSNEGIWWSRCSGLEPSRKGALKVMKSPRWSWRFENRATLSGVAH